MAIGVIMPHLIIKGGLLESYIGHSKEHFRLKGFKIFMAIITVKARTMATGFVLP